MADKMSIPGLAILAMHGGPKAKAGEADEAGEENAELRSAVMDLAHALGKMSGDGSTLENAACEAACDAFRRAFLACESEPHDEAGHDEAAEAG
jgi:hypothetical protein